MASVRDQARSNSKQQNMLSRVADRRGSRDDARRRGNPPVCTQRLQFPQLVSRDLDAVLVEARRIATVYEGGGRTNRWRAVQQSPFKLKDEGEGTLASKT
jgi:hypothetical protein